VLQWAREHGYQSVLYICVRAASHGHLEVLQWVREFTATGEGWNEVT